MTCKVELGMWIRHVHMVGTACFLIEIAQRFMLTQIISLVVGLGTYFHIAKLAIIIIH